MLRSFSLNKLLFCRTLYVLLIPGIAVAAEGTEQEYWNVIINWFPMVLLIGVWIYFMTSPRMRQVWGQSEEINRHLEKIAQTLDRIAKALEKR